MRRLLTIVILLGGLLPGVAQTPGADSSASHQLVAVIYYWKAKPGKMEEYSRYIQDVAEPVDRDAQRHGAFLSMATFVSQNAQSPWTHMRWFTLRDHDQAERLKAELDAATARVYPDEAKRKSNSEYATTLRDPAGSEEVLILSPKRAPNCKCE